MPEEVQRLRQFFKYNIPVNVLIAGTMFVLWLLYPFWSLLAIAIMVAGNIPGLTQTASIAIYDAVQAGDTIRAGWLTVSISLISIISPWPSS